MYPPAAVRRPASRPKVKIPNDWFGERTKDDFRFKDYSVAQWKSELAQSASVTDRLSERNYMESRRLAPTVSRSSRSVEEPGPQRIFKCARGVAFRRCVDVDVSKFLPTSSLRLAARMRPHGCGMTTKDFSAPCVARPVMGSGYEAVRHPVVHLTGASAGR